MRLRAADARAVIGVQKQNRGSDVDQLFFDSRIGESVQENCIRLPRSDIVNDSAARIRARQMRSMHGRRNNSFRALIGSKLVPHAHVVSARE